MDATTDRTGLEAKSKADLEKMARSIGVRVVSSMRKAQMIDAIMAGPPQLQDLSTANGTSQNSAGEVLDGLVASDSLKRSRKSKKTGKTEDEPVSGATPLASERRSAPAEDRAEVVTEPEKKQSAPRDDVSEQGTSAPNEDKAERNSEGFEKRVEQRAVRKVTRQDGSSGGSEKRTRKPSSPNPRQRRGRQQRQPRGGNQAHKQGNEGRHDDRNDGRNDGRAINRQKQSAPMRDAETGEAIERKGMLDILPDGYGFIRTSGCLPGKEDVYVSLSQIRRFHLRRGDQVTGTIRPPKSDEKFPALLRILEVNDRQPEDAMDRPRFEDLTPLFPDEKLQLEIVGDKSCVAQRIIDIIAPIGKGQRGLVVSPPKAGKTSIMKSIAKSVEHNNPEVHVIVLLVGERPEEVTDMQRSIKGVTIASTFDRPAEEHTQVAELTLEHAKRMVEYGLDVLIVLDGITRLARAYNLAVPPSGRILSGGVDSAALYPPKKFFGAARNLEEGGSLTIIATALVDTGSRMDEVIFEEFKGTGNMELRLDRRMAEKRVYPSIDILGSSTRQEQMLLDRSMLERVWKLRRVLSALDGGAGLELLIDKIRSTVSNEEFLEEIAKTPAGI